MSKNDAKRSHDSKKARDAAAHLIKIMGIIVPPIDPRKVAEFLGVGIEYRSFPKEYEDVAGYIRSHSRQIIVNDKQNASRMFFTIAHELGHDQLHRDYAKSNAYLVLPRNNIYKTAKPPEEVEADIFAANLLVPFNILKKYAPIASPCELARLFMVSEDVIHNQLYWMKIAGSD